MSRILNFPSSLFSKVIVGDPCNPVTSESVAFAINSNSKGFLPPRLTKTQIDSIVAPEIGLLVFNTTDTAYNYFNGTSWSGIGSGSSSDKYIVDSAGITSYSIVSINNSGNLVLASCDNLSQFGLIVGIIEDSFTSATLATVKNNYVMTNTNWNWTINNPITLGLNGALTQTRPNGCKFSQVIGTALSATKIFISLQEPILLV